MKNLTILNKLIIIYIILIKSITLGHVYLVKDDHSIQNSPGNEHLHFPCPPGTFYTSHPYPGDCTIYIECNNGQGSIKHCESDMIFDKARSFCYDKHKAKCDYGNATNNHEVSNETNDVLDNFFNDIIYCPQNLIGVYPHPFNNEKYLKCVYGRLYEKSCRPNFVYSVFQKLCEKNMYNVYEVLPPVQEKYSSQSKIQSNDSLIFLKCPSDLLGNFVHPFYCHYFINCSPAGTKITTCPSNEIFSFRRGKCLPESEININEHVECTKEEEVIDSEVSFSIPLGVYCTSEGILKYPYADNWHKYILCENGKLKIKWCPRNQVFLLEERECVDETEALGNT